MKQSDSVAKFEIVLDLRPVLEVDEALNDAAKYTSIIWPHDTRVMYSKVTLECATASPVVLSADALRTLSRVVVEVLKDRFPETNPRILD